MPLITQSDIAKKLNVSRITVSKALNDHSDISAEMKEKVRSTAKELGYIPHFHAKNLQSKKTNTIGVVVPDVSNSFFSFAIHGIIDSARLLGYHVILSVSQEDAEIEHENIMNLLSMRVDGLLVAISKNTTGVEIFETVKKMETPLVFFDRYLSGMGFPFVGIRDYNVAYQLVDYLIEDGYQQIGHIAGSSEIEIGKQRRLGYIDALKDHHLTIHEEWIVEGGFSKHDGYEGMKRLLIQKKLPEALFVANDRIAQGAYQAIKEAGLRIPQDIGVAAFGHTEFAELLSPTLTIMHVPPRNLGEKAMEVLAKVIQNKNDIKMDYILSAELQRKESIK